ncbi:MAG: sulfatase [Deltaproteobacteria bacterium]|nr:sulfatase [Deltaproteobacteria bacterium]
MILLLALACTRPPAPPPGAPDVVVVLADSLRADRADAAHMPALSRWAEGSARLTHARTPAAWTVPAVSSLFTALPPQAHRVLRHQDADGLALNRLSPELVTLAEVFQAGGYRTGALLKTDWLAPEDGFSQGFDTYQRVPGAGPAGESGAELTRAALSWLAEGDDRPDLLYLHYMDPHAPYQAPGAQPGLSPLTGAFQELEAIKRGDLSPSEADAAQLNALYDAEVRYLDRALGDLLLALPEGAVVLVLGDHGEQLLEHGGVLHEHLWEENVRVPWLLRAPSVAPQVLDGAVSTGSSAVTLVELAGLPPHPSWVYPSLAPMFQTGRPPQAPVVSEYADGRAIFAGGDALIRWGGQDRLYALDEDPDQRRDLAADRPAEVAALGGALEDITERSRALGRRLQGVIPAPQVGERREALCALGYLDCEEDR